MVLSQWYARIKAERSLFGLASTTMHRIVLLAFTLIPLVASAQQGVVRYSHTYPLLALSTDQITEHFVEQGIFDAEDFSPDPTHVTIARSLAFGSSSSLIYPAEEKFFEAGERTEDGLDWGWDFVDTTYVDHDNGTYVESRNLIDYKYLVKDELSSMSWQLVGKERTYLGYRVMKATAVVDSAVVEAWFTPEIPVPVGPGLYGGLPGLILMVTNAAIGEVYAADSIDLDAPSFPLMPPTAGREVSSDEYDQQVASVVAENEREWQKVKEALEESSFQ